MSNLEKATACWGNTVPDWITTLATQCDLTSQSRVATLIGYSPGVVSSVLAGTYRGNLASVEDAVRGAFMGSKVICPVLGEIPTHRCLEWRRKATRFAPTNAHRVRMYRACGCRPRNGKETEK